LRLCTTMILLVQTLCAQSEYETECEAAQEEFKVRSIFIL